MCDLQYFSTEYGSKTSWKPDIPVSLRKTCCTVSDTCAEICEQAKRYALQGAIIQKSESNKV